jgi:hypothetical protein
MDKMKTRLLRFADWKQDANGWWKNPDKHPQAIYSLKDAWAMFDRRFLSASYS